MKKTIAFIAGVSLCLFAGSANLRAGDTASPAPANSRAPTIGKNREEINQWLNEHPKLKAIALAKFDTNHNGILDGPEIPAFLKWLKERREKRKDLQDNGGRTTRTTPPAITSPTVQ